MLQSFPGTISAWKTEMRLYQAYRWLCDRVFCHAAPAGWTQEISVQEINQHLFEQQQCAVDTSQARTLVPVENCWEELAERQKVELQQGVSRADLALGDYSCYALGPAIYKVERIDGEQAVLKRIDKALTIPSPGARGDRTAPQTLHAVKVGSTYYTANSQTCEEVCGKGWNADCRAPEDAVGWYPAGPTSDCWVGADDYTRGKQCFCQKDEPKESATRGEHEKKFGSAYAGTETGKVKDRTGAALEDNGGNEWPWNYREWQVERDTKGRAGIFYPKERYYSGRDRSAAFGANYLLDYLNPPPKAVEVNPFTQHVGAFQSICLSGIRARLLLVRSILQGLQSCLKQVQVTGRADAGVCKEIFSQFVCNFSYKLLTFFQDRCVPEPFSKGLDAGDGIDDVRAVFRRGSEAITETIDSTASELQDEYGNAKLNQYLEGGSQALMKRVCLAAFGIEQGFDFNNFIDAAYSVPFKTSAMVFSSEGAVGRREFLSFNPQTTSSVYEYRAAWTIFPGCDLESYRIDLAAVTQREAREYPNIDCSAVNDLEGGNGCDNWQGSVERTRPFFSGGRVTQGVYVDQNGAATAEDPYRY
ncbi:MAG TPA: hypothetical protein VJB16_07680, partial [archaeon]|nr:hypothetical protein [archaeon]